MASERHCYTCYGLTGKYYYLYGITDKLSLVYPLKCNICNIFSFSRPDAIFLFLSFTPKNGFPMRFYNKNKHCNTCQFWKSKLEKLSITEVNSYLIPPTFSPLGGKTLRCTTPIPTNFVFHHKFTS